jgi:alanine racemase
MQATEDRDRTIAQMDRFESVAGRLADAGFDRGARHVAATGGLLTDVLALEGVRPGLSIYGLLPDELEGVTFDRAGAELAAGLRPVMSLHAQPVRVADVAVGDGVSYGPTWRAVRPSRVATLPLGYGDGYARSLSNRAEALVRGRRVPLVGNVAMDAIMADVTDVPGPPVTTDDTFVLLGEQGGERITAGDLARLRTTNRWEVVTQMAARLPRVYHAASAPVELRILTGR